MPEGTKCIRSLPIVVTGKKCVSLKELLSTGSVVIISR